MASSARSTGNIQLNDLFCFAFVRNTSNTWKHCQNANRPTRINPSLKSNLPSRPSTHAAPVKNRTAVNVSSSDSRLTWWAEDFFCPLPFAFSPFPDFCGTTFSPQMIAGTPMSSVMFVTLFTRQFVTTSAPSPPRLPST